MRKRVLLNLEMAKAWEGSGIGQCARNWALALAQTGRFDLRGVVHWRNLTGMPFPVTRSNVPYHHFFARNPLTRFCPFTYNSLVGDFASACTVFFDTELPWLRLRAKKIGFIYDLMHLKIPALMRREGHSDAWFDAFEARYRRLCDSADVVCTDSEHVRQDIIRQYGISEDRVAVIPPGVDSTFFATVDPRLDPLVRVKYNLPERYLLYFGGVREYKNVENIIRGYAILPLSFRKNVALVIAQRSDALAELVLKTGTADFVRFLGPVPETDKPAVFRLGSGFVFLSRFEGFGMPPIEAMAAGIPVLSSNCESLPEAVGNAALLTGPDDLDAIADGMRRLVEDEPLRTRLIAAGRVRSSQLTWSAGAEKLADVIDKVMGA